MNHDKEACYDDNFSYTKVWLQKVNRGELCHVHVSGEVHFMFKAMENVTK